jgi:hypothetical protein
MQAKTNRLPPRLSAIQKKTRPILYRAKVLAGSYRYEQLLDTYIRECRGFFPSTTTTIAAAATFYWRCFYCNLLWDPMFPKFRPYATDKHLEKGASYPEELVNLLALRVSPR